MSNQKRIKFLSYLALYTAMYIVLKYVGNLIPIFDMPNGGSVAVELIAICLASFHLGWKGGVAAALLSWLISIVIGFPMYFVHPIQIALDYALPLAVIGMSSLQLHYINLGRREQAVVSAIKAVLIFAGILLSFGTDIKYIILAAVIAAGVFAVSYWYINDKKYYGIIPAFFLRYLFTVLSGAYFWAGDAGAGSAAAWSFSLTYNLGYNLVSMIVCAIVVPMLAMRLSKVVEI